MSETNCTILPGAQLLMQFYLIINAKAVYGLFVVTRESEMLHIALFLYISKLCSILWKRDGLARSCSNIDGIEFK